MKAEVVWIDRGWQPVAVGFVPSAKAWEREMKRLRTPKPRPAYPSIANFGGHTQLFENDTTRESVILVTVGNGSERDALEVIMTIVHESVHVWQFICRVIGENSPGIETEAYAIESISRALIEAYTSTQGKGKKWL
jgi:hypothetical protein